MIAKYPGYAGAKASFLNSIVDDIIPATLAPLLFPTLLSSSSSPRFHFRFHNLEATMSSWVSNAPPGAVDDDRATTPLDIPQARLDKQVREVGYVAASSDW